jgi:ribonuclease D
MHFKKIKNGEIDIIFVATDEILLTVVTQLRQKTEFAFDTEFDRFWREYGFKLFLLQIFDGETCFLIDPLAIKNLEPLWQVFEDINICKVAYACTEDIQILKINNCKPVNIFDLQVAAKLCNHPANSFGDLVAATFNVTVDKSLQRSNWRTRPLNMAQQMYASHDVIWLLQLKKDFLAKALETDVLYMLAEENKYCEEVVVTEYEVKLSSKQKAAYTTSQKNKLLELFHVRNEIAQQYNMPPANIVTDATLETIILDTATFTNQPFAKGFCNRLMDDALNKEKIFNSIISSESKTYPTLEKKDKKYNNDKRVFYNADKETVEMHCKKINTIVADKYGTTAAEYILRGLKKALLTQPYTEISLKQYQHKVINDSCELLNITL